MKLSSKSTAVFHIDPSLQRLTAYQQEADPLYFKWQRGEASKEDWLLKIQEIKERYPDVSAR